MSGQFGDYGYGGVDDAQRQTEMSRKPKRFFVPKPVQGQPVPEKQIIFIDDNPLCFWEHMPMVNGQKYGHYFPCNQGVWAAPPHNDPTCIMCQNRIDKYYIGLWTVIDCSEFTFEGRVYKNLRRILAAKLETIKMLRKKSQTYGSPQRPGLIGKRFLVSRTSQRAARVGNVFDYIQDEEVFREQNTGRLILSNREFWYTDREGQQHPPTPYDYRKEYAALPNPELAQIIGLSMPGQGDVFDRAIQRQPQQPQYGAPQGQPQQPQQPQYGASAQAPASAPAPEQVPTPRAAQSQVAQQPKAVPGEVVDGVPSGAQSGVPQGGATDPVPYA